MIRGKDKETGELYEVAVIDAGSKWNIAYVFEDEGTGYIFEEDSPAHYVDPGDVELLTIQATLRADTNRLEHCHVFTWETEAAAKRALKQAETALKLAQSNKPVPEWAKLALEAGWKPPRGWKP